MRQSRSPAQSPFAGYANAPFAVARRRRKVAYRVLLGALIVACVAIAVFDSFVPHVRQVTVEVPGLARELRVLQITDLGSRRFGPRQSGLTRLVGAQRFDAVVLTGDMLSDDQRNSDRYQAVWDLADALRANSDHLWYLRGNGDGGELGPSLVSHGVSNLPGAGAVPLDSTDASATQVALVYGGSSASIAAAKGRGAKLLVIASHTPPDKHRLDAGRELGGGVHLFIAGHTHGGQIRLPLIGALAAPLSWLGEERVPVYGTELTVLPDLRGRLVDGMYDRDGQKVFVSHGLDDRIIPFRFLARVEMVEYRFVPVGAKP